MPSLAAGTYGSAYDNSVDVYRYYQCGVIIKRNPVSKSVCLVFVFKILKSGNKFFFLQ